MSTPDEIATEQPAWGKLTIFKGETLYEAVPQLVDPVDGAPFTLHDKTVQIYIRPTASDDRLIAHLTSSGSNGVRIIDPSSDGKFDIYYPQSNVDVLPEGKFWHFCNLEWHDDDLDADVVKTLWRGPCWIMPDNISVST